MEITTTDLQEIRKIAERELHEAKIAEAIADRQAHDKNLDDAIAKYNEVAKKACFATCRDAEKPMHHAILTYYWEGIRVKEKKDNDTGGIERNIETALKPIDLGELRKFMNNELGANTSWLYTAEKLNFYLTYRAADRMGASAVKKLLESKTDCFQMNKLAREIDMGKTPCSNTNLLKTLQRVVTEMLGEGYNVTSHDVNYLVDCYSNDNKKSKTAITAANHRTLRNYLKKICYRVLTNGAGYDAEQKEIKQDK